MSAKAVLDIAERVRARGINVVKAEGCETRGNGSSWGQIEGIVNHHTAGGNNIYIDQNLISGVPGLSGPLCNYCIMYDGDLGVIAAYPANHAGASGGWDTAPLPVTSDFNRRVLGVEIQYRGVEPMSEAQWKTMCILNYETNKYFDWSPDHIRCKTHNGTSIQGKWDPGYSEGKTYDIGVMRRAFAAVGSTAGDDLNSPVWKENLVQLLGVS